MTPQEQQLLQGLTDRINQTVLADKDPEAEQFLNQALGRNPDSVYILAQTVLVQQYALDQAKKQLDDLKQQQVQLAPPQPPARHTSFLGGLLGNDDAPARSAPPPPPPPQQQYSQPQYAPVPNYPPPAYGQPQYGQPQYVQPGYGAPMGGGGFLGSALRTAGGVAAGALAFEGIESLMHGFGEHAGYGGGSGFSGMGGGRPEEVINNYYGDSPEHEHHGISNDIEDRRDDNNDRQFAGNNDTSTSDDSSYDDMPGDSGSNDSGSDDSGSSDSSSFDDI